MEGFHHSDSAWPQGPSPADCGPPGTVGGTFPHTWAAPLPEEPNAASSAFQESPDAPGSSSSPTVQENKVDQSRAKKPKTRTTFTQHQLKLLRSSFETCRYITPESGCQLAHTLGLSYKQVKTWFQNQRLKAKRSQTMPLCTTRDHEWGPPPQVKVEPAVGPQGLGLPSSFHMISDDHPVNSHPENYSGWSSQASEDWLQNYREAPDPSQMAPVPYPDSPLEAVGGFTGWSYAMGSQTSQGHLPPLPSSGLGSLVQGSGASAGSAPSSDISHVPQGSSYPLMGPGLAAP